MLSAVVVTCNDGSQLEACLQSLTWAQEIVVADMHSDDASVAIAQRYSSAIYQIERSSHVELVRDATIRMAKGDWVVVVDPDERIPVTLAEAIVTTVSHAAADVAALRVARRNFFAGRSLRYGGWWPDWQIRVLRRDRVHWPQDVHSKPAVSGRILSLEAKPELAVTHLAYDSIRDFVGKSNRYTDVQSENLLQHGVRPRVVRMIEAPAREFAARYFYRLGFLDGSVGLIFAALYAWYFFLVEAKMLTNKSLSRRKPPEG